MKMIRKKTNEIVDVIRFQGNERTKELIQESIALGFRFIDRSKYNTILLAKGQTLVRLFPGNMIVRFPDGSLKAFDWRAEKDYLTTE